MSGRDSVLLLLGFLLLFHTYGAFPILEVNMEDRVEVFRGETAQISCMFVPSDDIDDGIVQWSYMTATGKRHLIYSQNATTKWVEPGTTLTERIGVNSLGVGRGLVLTIANVRLEDELEFICHIKNLSDGGVEGRTQLKVFETPERPVIEGVREGIWVNSDIPSKIATCEAKNGYPKPNITWYRNRTPLHSIHDEVEVVPTVTRESTNLYSVKSELKMRVTKEDADALFYCDVSYLVPGETRMTESERINITVSYPSTAVTAWVESPKGKIKEGDTVEIYCLGDGNPQPPVTIKHNDDETSLSSNVFVLKEVTRLQSGDYYCAILDVDTLEEITGNVTVFVNYLDHAVVTPEKKTISQGDKMTSTCNALSSLTTETTWFQHGKEISKGHTLTLNNATYDTAGEYECVVTVPEIEEMKTTQTLVVIVEGPPEIIQPSVMEMEVSLQEEVMLSCVVRGFPIPTITWTSSDGQAVQLQKSERDGDFIKEVGSIKLTSDVNVSCSAQNDLGSTSTTYSITTITDSTVAGPTTSITTSITTPTDKTETHFPPKKIQKEGSGVIIAVLIICILLLAILGSVLYFLYKKGKLCGRSKKQDLTKTKSNNDNIVVELKSDNTEEAVLLGVNGDKKAPSEQGDEYLNVQK
ncbi:melanoma cell adhesion molecule b isoform X2 [Thalassophryne amazonica]|uniref:melanoma cell adhesion molecule b isoform X2 n=1 Tax=Thalassophryne amazonica TaxID=390379 RepID=UPI001470B852|nr:melanoma cell adhesion molecule b isoform X2 [Thalassophryne amazonica]